MLGVESERRRVGAGAGLAEREGGDGAARADFREPAFAVGRGTRLDQWVRAESLEGQRGLGLRAAAGQGLAQQTQLEGS